MKLNRTFIQQDVCDLHVAVSQDYNGMLCVNESAIFILEMLKNETTEEAVLDAMCERYDAPRSQLKIDLEELIAQLREKGLIDE